MAKYIIEGSTLTGLADALRKVTGENRTYTPTEMIEAVTTIMDSATYILVDEDGNEYPAVFVENETVFTATANDIRIGTVAASNNGVVVGEKNIPAYYVTEGYRLVPNGSVFETPPFIYYDFTKLQAIVCPWDGSLLSSTAAEKVVINENVYPVNSTESLATVIRDDDAKKINLGITNDSGGLCVMRYFTYKEEL